MERKEVQKERVNDDNGNPLNITDLDVTVNRTVLDSTVSIENKLEINTEYCIRGIVKKKLIFKSRPKPIIANIAKTV